MASAQHPEDSDQPALFDAPTPPAGAGGTATEPALPEQPALFEAPHVNSPQGDAARAETPQDNAPHVDAAPTAAAKPPLDRAPHGSDAPDVVGSPQRPAPGAPLGGTAVNPLEGTVVGPDASWTEGPRACFDLETTGRDPQQARIVTASVVLVSPTGDVLREWEWLADPGIEIPEEAAAVHGVSTERARAEGRPAAEVAAELDGVLAGMWHDGVPVLAFNAAYDLTVLARENERHNLPAMTPMPVLDPFVLNKQVHRYRRGKRTLGALCEEYGVVLDAAHTSAADALATERLATALAERFAELRQPATALHELQIGWAAEQAASLQEYFRRKDPDAVVDGTWPVHPRP